MKKFFLLCLCGWLTIGMGEISDYENDTAIVSRATPVSFTRLPYLPKSISPNEYSPDQITVEFFSTLDEFNKSPYSSLIDLNSFEGFSFQDSSLVIADFGLRSSGGYSITISELYSTNSTLIALIQTSSPPPNALVTMAFTHPIDVVKIPKSSYKYVKFREVSRETR